MAVGFHSPFCFWTGGAGVSAPTAAVGERSRLAPWVGGAGVPSDPDAPVAGYRSALAPWVGGAGVTTGPPAPAAGYRSLLGFWVGGAAATAGAPPPAPVPFPGGGYFALPPDIRLALRQRQIDEDDILLLLAASIDGRSLH